LPTGGVGFQYRDLAGNVTVRPRRTLNPRSSRWKTGSKALAYGLWFLHQFRQGKKLVLVEGETDSLTAWFHRIPAIGIPGAATVQSTLAAEIVEGIDLLEIVQESDEAGSKFVQGIAAKLAELKWSGVAKVIRFSDAKDTSELYLKHGPNFLAAFEAASRSAVPLNEAIAAMQPSVLPASEWPDPSAIEPQRGVVADGALSLPKTLGPWVSDVAERMGVPIANVGIFAVTGLSTIVGRKVSIRPKANDDWAVVPNLWSMLIAPPGGMKSPIMNAGLAPVRALEERARRQAEAQRAHAEVQRRVQKHTLLKLENAIKEAVDRNEDTSRFVEEMNRLLAAEPVMRRYITNDSTIESLGELLRQNPNGLLIFRDELMGLFSQFDREGHEQDRPFFIEGWNGNSSYSVDRISRGSIVILGLRLTITGTIQPEPFRQQVRQVIRGVDGGDGLLQRFQLLVSDGGNASATQIDRPPNDLAAKTAFEAFDRLDSLNAQELGAIPDERQPYLRFGAQGQALFDGG
jgi:hypothetical protein